MKKGALGNREEEKRWGDGVEQSSTGDKCLVETSSGEREERERDEAWDERGMRDGKRRE